MIKGTYYREKGTGLFMRIHPSAEVRHERIGRDQGRVYRVRICDEDTGFLDTGVLVSDKYIKDNCSYWKAELVPDYVKKKLREGW